VLDDNPRHYTTVHDFRKLIQWIADGELGLPDFQRNFVWDVARVNELLDSVSRGWPIGSILMLEGPQPFGLKQIAFGPDLEPDVVQYYLLDGQQRLTSLYLAALDVGDDVFFVDLAVADDHGEYPFQSMRRPRYRPSASQFTFAELLDPRAFDDRLSTLSSEEADAFERAREQRMGSLLGSYTIPSITMSNDIPLEALTRIFETLNRTGLRLNAFDLMVAVLRSQDFKLREAWIAALDSILALEMLHADGVEILKVIALWQKAVDEGANRPVGRRVQGVRQGDVLNIPGDFVATNWNSAVSAYSQALELLITRAGVHDRRSVPAWAMVLPMAYWLDRGVAVQSIERWYWQNIAFQRYAQGANTQVISDIHPEPKLEDRADVVSAVTSALGDQTRRSRILRLGLRGLTLSMNQKLSPSSDWSVGQGREVSVRSLLQNQIAADGGDPLVDMLYLSARQLADVRTALRRGGVGLEAVSRSTWEAQGFNSELLGEPERLMSERIQRLSAWIGDLS
jgi:hypothetical protein